MKMNLKYCQREDLDYLKQKYQKEIEHLYLKNDDCTYKNFIIYDFVLNSDGGRDKFVDCGSGPSPLAWLLCDYFKDGYMIDVSVKNPFQKPNLHHNIDDFFSYMETHDDDSIDYALDGCSITHFEYNSKSNTGLLKAADVLYRKVKKGGYLVIASDVLSHFDQSNHDQGEFITVKDMIDIYESKGFKLIGDFDYNSLNEEYVIDLEYHGISRFNLAYSNLIFKKL
jgi:hypothetical protein